MVTPISIKLTLSETTIFNLAQVRTRFTRLFDALLHFVLKQGRCRHWKIRSSPLKPPLMSLMS